MYIQYYTMMRVEKSTTKYTRSVKLEAMLHPLRKREGFYSAEIEIEYDTKCSSKYTLVLTNKKTFLLW